MWVVKHEHHTNMKTNTVEIKAAQIVRACSFGSLVIAYAKNKWGKERGTIIEANQHAQADGALFEHFYASHRIEMEPSQSHKAYFNLVQAW